MRAMADFPLDGKERFLPVPFKIALARTWHPAFSPSTMLERQGPVLLEWPRFQRVLATLRGFTGRQDFIGKWSRAELRAVDAALAGKPLALKAGDPLRETLQTGVDHWLINVFEHLTVGKGLTPRQAYGELARIRHVGTQAMAQKISRLRDLAYEHRDENAPANAAGWSGPWGVSQKLARRAFVERRRRTVKDPESRAYFETLLRSKKI